MNAHNRVAGNAFCEERNDEIAVPVAPLIERRDHGHPSVFLPEVLLEEARKQKNLKNTPVPEVCLLDPDGDITNYVRHELGASKSESWGCFHTELWEWTQGMGRFGVVGRAVGASFAVLVAEQLFVSGCTLLISISSAGAIASELPKPSYVLIKKALRDEGTSYHYLPASPFAAANELLFDRALECVLAAGLPVIPGISWTTDAPFRETAQTIMERQQQGVHAVEMEAAALLAFAQTKRRRLLAIAHVTNAMGQGPDDFDKGDSHGAATALSIVSAIAGALHEDPANGL